MLTRDLYLSASWFILSLIATLWGGTRLKRNQLHLSFGWLVIVILLGDGWAFLTYGVPSEIFTFSLITFFISIFWIYRLPDWNALGQVCWSMTLITTGVFILYAFRVTAFSPLNPISFLIAITFFFIESAALLLALTHTYESLDVTCRTRWRRKIKEIPEAPGYAPMVSLHLPTYNEPLEVVEQTLLSLAELDYPNYEVLVVDNNTPDETTWRPLEDICRRLGPNFHCLHLDQWPGYKSGALNFAMAQTHPKAEIIGTIDADYQLDPSFLRQLVPAFIDPQIAFLQTPQDYRDFQGDVYKEATYFGYKYFFEISMPSRNEHNAIIFAGTMGLIRRSVLEEIGGWDEWCITEDAEASLRILKRGYQSIYVNKTFGRGLMPFNFEGLKKQRFRWCFGGIQILKKHWEALMPWAHWVDPNNQLSLAQRYYYLVGGLQWFTDLFNLLFALFLMFGVFFSIVPTALQIRPLTSAIMIMPALFLILNLWRFVWVLRNKLQLSVRKALMTMFNFFSLGWAVTLASIQGIIQKRGVFLRTPKSKSGGRTWQAIRVTQWESLIGVICISSGILSFAIHPTTRTLFLGSLLVWQSSLYLAAPVYSLLSEKGNVISQAQPVERGTPILEHWAARWALGLAAILVIAVGLYQLLPGPRQAPAYSRYQPMEVPPGRLFGFERVPLQDRALPPTLTPTPIPTETNAGYHGPVPSLTPTATVTATTTMRNTPTITPTLVITPTSAITGTPGTTPNPLPTITPVPSLIPESTPIPTQIGTPDNTLTPTPNLSLTPTVGGTPVGSFTPIPDPLPSPTRITPITPIPFNTPTPILLLSNAYFNQFIKR